MRNAMPVLFLVLPIVAGAADQNQSTQAPAQTEGRTFHITNYGVDSDSCGTAASPCRSITQGINLAEAGDTVLVGPGRYGDSNGDGDFSDPGDEQGDSSVITLARSGLRVISEYGARVTLIDATGTSFNDAVLIIARGTQFGAPRHGFRVLATGRLYGIEVSDNSNDVTVAGNVVTGGTQGSYLFPTRGRGAVITDNLAIDTVEGPGFTGVDNLVDPGTGAPARVARNVSIRNLIGFNVGGPDLVFSDNIADDNAQGAMVGGDGAIIRRSYFGNSGSHGVFIEGAVNAFVNNNVIGNRGPGVVLAVTGTIAQFSRNNIYGNGTSTVSVSGEPPNCGVFNASGTRLDALNTFWGSPAGPGSDPADMVCNAPGGSTIVFVPFATRPFKRPLMPPRW